MADKKQDQDAEILEEETPEGESPKEKGEPSEEPKEEPLTLENLAQLAKGLQKGYTITRQEMAEMRESLQEIANAGKKESGDITGDEEYLTAGKLKEILQAQAQEQYREQARAEKSTKAKIDSDLADLRAKGIVKSDREEEELINYAIAKKELDLNKAADRWLEVKLAKDSAIKEISQNAAKNKVQQEEGSNVGTSSKASVKEQGGIDYEEIRNKDWYELG